MMDGAEGEYGYGEEIEIQARIDAFFASLDGRVLENADGKKIKLLVRRSQHEMWADEPDRGC